MELLWAVQTLKNHWKHTKTSGSQRALLSIPWSVVEAPAWWRMVEGRVRPNEATFRRWSCHILTGAHNTTHRCGGLIRCSILCPQRLAILNPPPPPPPSQHRRHQQKPSTLVSDRLGSNLRLQQGALGTCAYSLLPIQLVESVARVSTVLLCLVPFVVGLIALHRTSPRAISWGLPRRHLGTHRATDVSCAARLGNLGNKPPQGPSCIPHPLSRRNRPWNSRRAASYKSGPLPGKNGLNLDFAPVCFEAFLPL